MSELRPTGPNPPEPASVLRPNLGVAKAPSSEVPGMPVNYGEGLLPHVVTFQGIISSVSRVYRYYDEAMKASQENARFMRNDLMIMEPVEQRRRACALLNWHIEVDDAEDPTEKRLAEDLTKIIKRIPQFLKFRECLLDAVWFGKYACQFNWKWSNVRGVTPVNGLGQNMIIDHWKPVHGDKVVFRYDDGSQEYDPNQVGIRVGAGYSAGDKGIQGRLNASGRHKVEPTDYGLAYFLEPWERTLLAIHKHMVEDGEYEDPQSAGKIHGLGIRSRIYWTWYMKQEMFAYLLEYLERSATGIEIWYYPSGNPEAEAKVRQAAQDRIGNNRNIVLMPRPVGEDAQAFGVEIVQPNIAGIEALRVLVDEYFGNAIMRYVLGQTMTNKPQSAGLGSDLPQIQLGSYLQIIRYDAINLGETLTTDLVDVIKANNYPHLLDIPCRFVIDTESEDVQSKLEAWGKAYEVGVKTKASDWLKMIGASKPEETDEIIQNPVIQQQDRLYQQFLQRKQAAEAMGMTPEGEPQPGDVAQPMEGELGQDDAASSEPGPQDGMEAEVEPEPAKYSMREGSTDDADFDPTELAKGTEEEMKEHGFDWAEARKVAKDHLRENPHYYTIVDKALKNSGETKPDKYMRADGTRWADIGIAEGRNEKDWQNVSTDKYCGDAEGDQYAKKSGPGQGNLFDENKHPRGKPDNAGQFAEKGSQSAPKSEGPKQPESLPGQTDIDGNITPPDKPKPKAPEPAPKQRQEAMFHGLKDAPGQQDLFNADKGAGKKEPWQMTTSEWDRALSPEARKTFGTANGGFQHRNFVLNAILEGESVPGYVESEYPGIREEARSIVKENAEHDTVTASQAKEREAASASKAADQKDEDERRRTEEQSYRDDQISKRHTKTLKEHLGGYSPNRQPGKLLAYEHRESVKAALADGKSVPPEVLADYPDLQSKPQRHSNIYDQMLARYYKASTDEQVESFWAGDERDITVIQEGRPMRYSRKHGQVSAQYITNEAT